MLIKIQKRGSQKRVTLPYMRHQVSVLEVDAGLRKAESQCDEREKGGEGDEGAAAKEEI